MTLLELQKILGENIQKIDSDDLKGEEKENVTKKADIIARLAKQMINNADIVLRTDKMREMQGIKTTAISRVVGYDE